MVCPPSQGFLALSPMLPFLGWCVRLPENVVSPLVAQCELSGNLNAFLSFSFGFEWCVCLPEGFVSLVFHCTPSCFQFLDGLFPFPRVLSLLFPIGWYVRLPEGLVFFISSALLVSLCWIVSAFPKVLFPFVGRLLEGLVSPGLLLFPHMCACVGFFVRTCLPLSPLSPIASHSLPVLSFFPLSPIVSPHVRLCLMACYARLPEVLFLHVSHCLPTCVPLFDGVLCPPP